MEENILNLKLLRKFGPLKYLFPIQTISQFCSVVVIVLLGMNFPIFLKMISTIELDISPAHLFFVVLAGVYPSLYMAMPFQLIIASRGKDKFSCIDTVRDVVGSYGYRCIFFNEYEEHWVARMPRWLRWRENEIYVYRKEDIEIAGPGIVIKRLHEKLRDRVL